MPSETRYPDRRAPLQATLHLLALQAPHRGPRHRHGLSHATRANSGEVPRVDAGSLYPALQRPGRPGRVGAGREVSGHDRRVTAYRLTAGGKKQLASGRTRRGQLSGAVTRALKPRGEEGGA